MKNVLLLCIASLLMATQCDTENDDSLFITTYFIQNDSNVDLVLVTDELEEVVIASQSTSQIGLSSSFDGAVVPSESTSFNAIELLQEGTDGTLTTVYEQDPITDNLWTLNNISDVDIQYTLIITDEILD